ncbi:hypothetical protein PENTCL1PPCAC_2122, partial [Pristionchus entomophagus]
CSIPSLINDSQASPLSLSIHSSEMEDENHPYLNWLLQYDELQSGFANSFYFVQFCENIINIYQDGDEKIPLIAIIKDLQMEEEKRNESENIRQLVIHLLKLVSLTPNQIDSSNYNFHLRDIMDTVCKGMKNPLTPCKSFHSLDSEVKLYILFRLLQESQRPIRYLNRIAIDSEDNQYFLAKGGRLYVQYGKRLNNLSKIHFSKGVTKPRSVERHLNELRPMKLLAETKEQWTGVARFIKNFGENETSLRIIEKMEEALLMMSEEMLHRMVHDEHEDSIPKMGERNGTKSILRMVNNGLRVEKQVTFSHFLCHIRTFEKEESKKWLRCHYYPNCTKEDDVCNFAHPKEKCDDFISESRKCERLRDCPFLHGFCPVDGNCVEDRCVYEHQKQRHYRTVTRR